MNKAITNDQILDLAEKHLTLDFGDVLDFSRRLIALAAPMQPSAAADDARDALKAITAHGEAIAQMLTKGKVRTSTDVQHQEWKRMQKTWDALMAQANAALSTPAAKPAGE